MEELDRTVGSRVRADLLEGELVHINKWDSLKGSTYSRVRADQLVAELEQQS